MQLAAIHSFLPTSTTLPTLPTLSSKDWGRDKCDNSRELHDLDAPDSFNWPPKN